MLVHVALGLVALMAVSALAVDYGAMWVSRRQAQNSADAAALAAAVQLAFVDAEDQTTARSAAVALGRQNQVWAEAPDVTDGDITFPACPPGSPGVPDTCVRANVFRNQRASGNPLPMFFGQFVNLTEQGTRATATAQMLTGDAATCVKPWAVPDKWLERRPVVTPWEPTDTFERYVQNGPNSGQVLNPADVYVPPSSSDPGSGLTVEVDYGTRMVLKNGNPHQAVAPGWFYPVVINPAEGGGADNYRENIAACDPTIIDPSEGPLYLETEPGNMTGPTRQGVEALLTQDLQGAHWDDSANGGKGGPVSSCMSPPNPTCSISPRIVPLPVFDPDEYDSGRASGRQLIKIVKLMGFWVEGMDGGDVVGYLMTYPALATGNSTMHADANFLRTVILVR